MNNLFILLLIPLLSAIVLFGIKNTVLAKRLALGLALIQVLATIPFLLAFQPEGLMQFEQSWNWISALGVRLHIGVDGISLPLVLLTNALIPLIVLTTYDKDFKGNFYGLVAFMQAGLLLVFLALDAFSFYVGWEVALIPIYFICGLWGEGDRIRVNLKFFIYTFFGSLLMLVAILYLYNQVPDRNFEWSSFVHLDLSETTQRWVFWAFFIAFAIKIPVFPLHTWQPATYTHAPTAGTMLLAGIMLKMGVYGIIRWLLPVAPFAVLSYGPLVMTLCVIGLIYASIIAFKQQDAKRLIAFSSIAHVGLITAGVFSLRADGLQGAIIQMVNHGFSVVGLFLVIDIIEKRLHTRQLNELGGLASKLPEFAVFFLIILLGAIGLPLTNGFIGEFLLLKGIFGFGVWYAVAGGLTLILGAVYMLRFYQKTMLGTPATTYGPLPALSSAEFIVLLVVVTATLFLGVVPDAVMHLSEASVVNLLNQIKF